MRKITTKDSKVIFTSTYERNENERWVPDASFDLMVEISMDQYHTMTREDVIDMMSNVHGPESISYDSVDRVRRYVGKNITGEYRKIFNFEFVD